MLTITLFASLAVLTLPFLRPDGGRRTPLQIVVAEPELSGSGVDLRRQQLLLEAVRDGLERQLHGRRGLSAPRFFVPAGRALEIAREIGADEVLATRIKVTPFGAPYGAQIGLGRRRTIDGNLVWQRDETQIAVDDLRRVDRQIAEELQLAYIRYERPPEAAQLFAEAADYEAFLRLRLELHAGADAAAQDSRFAALRAGSPRFFEAYLWPARALAARLAAPAAGAPAGGAAPGPETNVRDADTERALMLLEQAGRMAPADPRPLEAAFRLLLARQRGEEAAQRLAALEQLRAGDPVLTAWRALLDAATAPPAAAPPAAGQNAAPSTPAR